MRWKTVFPISELERVVKHTKYILRYGYALSVWLQRQNGDNCHNFSFQEAVATFPQSGDVRSSKNESFSEDSQGKLSEWYVRKKCGQTNRWTKWRKLTSADCARKRGVKELVQEKGYLARSSFSPSDKGSLHYNQCMISTKVTSWREWTLAFPYPWVDEEVAFCEFDTELVWFVSQAES